MLIDRDLFIDAMFNVSKFEQQGMPAPRRWATVLPVGEEAFWLDPRQEGFGANRQYLEYDPQEARKLVTAATGRAPIKEQFTYIEGNEYGPDYRREAEILQGMWQANGDFELRANVVDYNTVFLPRYSINGQARSFEGGGVALAGVAPFPEPDLLFGEWYMPGGAYYKFEPDYPNDAQWESLMKAQRSELDGKKRWSLLNEIQRHHAGKMYTIHRPGSTLGYALKQPWLANAGAFISASSNTFAGSANASTSGLHWWLDRSKMP
jgi:ABC-type transport system substrate-binding protein